MSEIKLVFDFEDYKAYLKHKISAMPAKGRGVRLAMAEALGCQTAYVSQVLNQYTHFSLEQAVKVNQFLKHDREESRFFLLQVQLGRAGSQALESFIRAEMQDILQKRRDLELRINIKDSLDESNQHIYYSAWYYAAIHVMLSIPAFQDPDRIADYLRLPLDLVFDVIEFLMETGLANRVGDKYQTGQTSIHLSKNSVQVKRHHSNWRNQAINSIDRGSQESMHYSNVLSMGNKDVEKVRKIITDAVEEARKIIRVSPEERIQILNIDFFKL